MDDPRVGDGVTVAKAQMNVSSSGNTGSHRTSAGSLVEDCGQEVCYLKIHLGSVIPVFISLDS